MVLTTHLLELMAAIAASYYWYRTKENAIRPFIWLLWFTVFIETIGLYTFILQNNYDDDFFIWLKNSAFCSNTWLYNIYSFLYIIFLGVFYQNHLLDVISKKTITIILILSSSFSIIYFGLTNGFFDKSIPYDFAIQTFVIFVFVMLYFKELIRSDDIIVFYKSHVFYISVAILLWYLCVTPLVIFDGYFYAMNTEFVRFRSQYLLISNIFLYTCLTFGFLFSLYHKNKLVPNK